MSWQEATRYGNIIRLIKQGDHCIKVKQNDQYRWLEIDGIMQSLMSLQAPSAPVLPPHQAMTQIFPKSDQSGFALEFGLGGGAMQRYFAANRPQCTLTSVELSETILELFHQHFAPEHSGNKTIQGRAERIVLEFLDDSVTDLIIDICTDEGLPEFLSDPLFWQETERVLAPNANLAVNLIPQNHEEWERVTQLMREILTVPLGWIQIPQHLNILVVSDYS